MSVFEDAAPAGGVPRAAAGGSGGPRTHRGPVRRLLLACAQGWGLIGVSIWNGLVWSAVVTAACMVSGFFGLFLVPPALVLLRRTANAARSRSLRWSGVEIEEPYRPLPPEVADAPGFLGSLNRLWHQVTDPQNWRDLAWAGLDWVVGALIASLAAGLFLYGVYGFVLGACWAPLTHVNGMNDWYTFVHVARSGALTNLRWATFPVGAAFIVGSYWAAPAAIRLHGRWTRLLLGPTTSAREAALSRRVTRLTETRAVAADSQAAELRRIERDLHDGAQARLVAMGMNLGAAEALLDEHPEAARALLVEAREASAKALTELRALVRGIHPPVLADRGLGDAVRALALDSPLRVEVTVELPGRLEPAVESAAYFAVSELLTNVAKHAHAENVRVDLWHGAGRLRVTCTDDGRGGAVAGGADAAPGRGPGSGLAGIERRIGTFDGVMAVRSPVGGPTVVTLEIPCASSSAKTSTS
jgi:signal transduction histidine kinase